MKPIIEDKSFPEARLLLSEVDPGPRGRVQIFKPEGGRKPGFGDSQPSSA